MAIATFLSPIGDTLRHFRCFAPVMRDSEIIPMHTTHYSRTRTMQGAFAGDAAGRKPVVRADGA